MCVRTPQYVRGYRVLRVAREYRTGRAAGVHQRRVVQRPQDEGQARAQGRHPEVSTRSAEYPGVSTQEYSRVPAVPLHEYPGVLKRTCNTPAWAIESAPARVPGSCNPTAPKRLSWYSGVLWVLAYSSRCSRAEGVLPGTPGCSRGVGYTGARTSRRSSRCSRARRRTSSSTPCTSSRRYAREYPGSTSTAVSTPQ
jgi:hypothetical protein